MIAFFANLFGYVLNFLYEFIGNYGFAIILFSLLVKAIMIPISISQQKTMKKSQKVNDEMKQIQFKYKNDPEKLNQEVMNLNKREKMSPFSGCFSAIIQIILLFSVFYLVRSPLTYMKKVDSEVINKSIDYVQKTNGSTSNYKEIAVINYINNLENAESVSETSEIKENNQNENNIDSETQNNNENEEQTNNNENSNTEDFNISDYKDSLYINMNFLGIDLSKVPTEDLKNIKALIIPILYVISSFISIRLTTNMNDKKEEKNKLISEGIVKSTENKENEEDTVEENRKTEKIEESDKSQDFSEAMADTNKKMAWFMPLMSISIAMVAPLGLALYWLMNNILMILERLILNKFIKD